MNQPKHPAKPGNCFIYGNCDGLWIGRVLTVNKDGWIRTYENAFSLHRAVPCFPAVWEPLVFDGDVWESYCKGIRAPFATVQDAKDWITKELVKLAKGAKNGK